MTSAVCEVVVRQPEGLHARPAARLAKLAKSFRADVEIRKGEVTANGKSAVKLMLLAVKEGERILISADGEDADTAVQELSAFVSDAAGEREPAPAPAAPPPSAAGGTPRDGALHGTPASEGAVVAPAFIYLPRPIDEAPRDLSPDAVPAEIDRFRAALAAVAAMLDHASETAAGSTQAQVFATLRELAADGELVEPIERLIADGQDAASATLTAGRALAERFARIDDAYFQLRADDVRGITRRIAGTLRGADGDDLARLDRPSVVIAADLSAIDLARLRPGVLAGLLTTQGGPTSHLAIVARSLGIPAVSGVRAPEEVLRRARTVALDGSAGLAILDPPESVVAEFEARARQAQERRRETERFIHAEPRLADGTTIEVAANVGSLADIDAALAGGAMGIGLFRTEFLFMEAAAPPSEDEQYRTYARALEAFAPRPVIVRTLDIGGDKQVPGLAFEPEANPFLGWRGIRMCLDSPALFEPQLRALLRAAVHGRLRVMFPMISDVSEVLAARACLDRCRVALEAEGQRTGPIEVGIMIETPAAAICAPELAQHVAFFSIGTNDLTQYTMAADRTNARLARLHRADHPAVLRMIELACRGARGAGIWVGVCGEAAGDPALIPRLLSWGVTELSMSAPLIARAKRTILEGRRPGALPLDPAKGSRP